MTILPIKRAKQPKTAPTNHVLAVCTLSWYNHPRYRGVAQLVARSVRDAEVGGSSPLTPTRPFLTAIVDRAVRTSSHEGDQATVVFAKT